MILRQYSGTQQAAAARQVRRTALLPKMTLKALGSPYLASTSGACLLLPIKNEMARMCRSDSRGLHLPHVFMLGLDIIEAVE